MMHVEREQQMYNWDEMHYASEVQGPAVQQTYVKEVERAINDELHAIHFYAKLMELAENAADRQRISQIRQDEIRHYHQIYRYYMSLTGRHPQLNPGEVPETFKEGVRKAIADELEAVAHYQNLMNQTTDPRARQMWMRIGQDEQRHAMWLMWISGKSQVE
jgi:rubrerythrin